MKASSFPITKALQEVWDWKEAVYQKTKDMTFDEKRAYFQRALEEAARSLHARIVENPDGSCTFVRDNAPTVEKECKGSAPPRKPRMLRTILYALMALGLVVSAVAQPVDLYTTDYMAPQTGTVAALGDHATTSVRLRATPGEYEPFTFSFRPRERLEAVFIKPAGPLAGPKGKIDAANIGVAGIESYHGGDYNILVPVGNSWDMPAWSRELFWVTIHVPADAAPASYTGQIAVTSQGKSVGAIAITLEVLPFRLDEPPYALGFNYSSPKDPKKLAAHLRDMREHGMTTVAPLYNFHLPVNDSDTGEIGAFIEAFKQAGFTKTLYLGSPMELMFSLAGYGPVDSRRFQQKYLQTMRRIFAETQKHDVPVIFSIADELTNRALPGIKFGEQLARLCFEELPEISVTSDMNGYLEVTTMAPYLNVATFNNGWDGIDHHNKGRRLINRAFLEEVQTLGAIPWFVNAGEGRFPFGFFFWKMAKYGVKGKVEWYYNLGNNEKGSVVRLDGERIYPTVTYERSREGVDDLKYALKLESLIAEAKKAGRGESAAVRHAEALLKELGDSIVDNWTAYSDGGESWPPARYHEWRQKIVDETLALVRKDVNNAPR
jgi:hypothetical protein